MDQQNQQRRLGRGLSALLGGQGPTSASPVHSTVAENGVSMEAIEQQPGEMRYASAASIEPSPFQPRRDFDGEDLNELVSSVREHGVLSPVLVREVEGGFQLIAGERRLRAAKKAGLETVPVRVVDVVDQTACEYALEENLKRADLNDLEKARAFRRYLEQFQTTQDELAKQLSMSRPALSNMLRLLDLPEAVQQALEQGKISGGHAKAILSLSEPADMVALCGAIQADGLSVRKAEAEARSIKERAAAAEACVGTSENEADDADRPRDILPMTRPQVGHATAHVQSLEGQLRERLGVNVDIRLTGKEKGRIVIPFADNAEFERLLSLLRHGEQAAA